MRLVVPLSLAVVLAGIVQWDADHEGAFAWSFGLKPRRVWRGGTPVQ